MTHVLIRRKTSPSKQKGPSNTSGRQNLVEKSQIFYDRRNKELAGKDHDEAEEKRNRNKQVWTCSSANISFNFSKDPENYRTVK
ncbi:hypothetical protein ACROYT_G007278 [Oculina patagonica]